MSCSTSTYRCDDQISINFSSKHCITVYVSTNLIVFLAFNLPNCTVQWEEIPGNQSKEQRRELQQAETKSRAGQATWLWVPWSVWMGWLHEAVCQVQSGGWQEGLELNHPAVQQSVLLRVIHHSTTHCCSSRLELLWLTLSHTSTRYPS